MNDEVINGFMWVAITGLIIYTIVQTYMEFPFWDATKYSTIGVCAILGWLYFTRYLAQAALRKVDKRTNELIEKEKSKKRKKGCA